MSEGGGVDEGNGEEDDSTGNDEPAVTCTSSETALTMGRWIVVARLPGTCFTFWPKGSRVLGSVWNSLDQMVFKDDGLWA